MDTTPKYIEMCEKAEEIQESRPPINPVTLYRLENGDVIDSKGSFIACVESNDCVLRYKYIWLPRQDELQEMVKESSLSESLTAFYHWNYDIGFIWKSDKEFTSMEQLWLAYVMQELYQKVWTGEEWVKEDN